MWSRFVVLAALAAAAIALAIAPAAAGQGREKLEMYTVAGNAGKIARATEGLELAGLRYTRRGIRADVVLTNAQRAKLVASGVKVRLKRNRRGRTVSAQAAAQAAGGYNVYRSWDEPGGIRDELYRVARENPQIVKLEVLGRTHQGRELIALKVTQGARGQADGSRPAVLYSSNQHAREWISLEVNRRLLHHFIERWRANDREIRELLGSTELWFVISANPDGYQYTFDHERLWRKNLRDNNGDGQTTTGDGVDPNRNFAEHWGYDDEGSSNDPADETYRGPSAGSEPETRALAGLIDRIKPKFQSNFHSFGQWLLYPQGWQIGTLDADNPIYVALGGTDAKPAIPGFNPGQSADTLYVTNGETTDYAETSAGTIAYTPELGEGRPGAGFVFPDDEALIQAEFVKTRAFSLGLARSAQHPADPVSPVGIGVKPFYLDQDDIDPQNGQQSLFDFKFAVSYGDPQEVRVLAKRSLGAVTLRYQVNGGAVQSKPTSEWDGDETYGPGNDVYYHVVRGSVTGTSPGDSVKVWFTGGGATSDSFTYEVESDSGRRVLIVSAEDYTGASPVYANQSGPNHLSFYTDALTANGVAFDVYDVDAHGRTAPDALGVLNHYDAVAWYTGNDTVTREPGWGAGNASRLAMQEMLELRDFVNAGGRVLYTGRAAGQQYTPALGTQLYDPFENKQCRADPAVQARCLALLGSGNSQGDPIEYMLGAAITSAGGGLDPDTGEPFEVDGFDDGPFAGLSWGFNGADSAQNQNTNSSFIATGDFLKVTDPEASFPQFESRPVAEYRSGLAGPFDPHTGSSFMWSQRADEAYKRLSRTITVPAGGATLSFWTSYNLELDFDYLVVEAHTVGQDDWTTLPDARGHTSDDLSTDESCTGGWSNPADAENVLHPFLTHYQTFDAATGTCSNTGSTGQWHAANGSSGGWQQWEIDLGRYANSQVEVSITALSDWGLQQFPGVFIDDIVVSTGEGSTSFEDDAMGGWTIPGAPQDDAGVEGPNRNDWTRRGGLGIKEGAVIATPDTIYMGHGFEGITDAATRTEVMGRAITYLLR
jgi:Zinc carboxypeptidase/Immune inhibitor A-like, MAM domain